MIPGGDAEGPFGGASSYRWTRGSAESEDSVSAVLPTIPGPDPQGLYEVAERQYGFFTVAQARKVGYSPQVLGYHARRGRLERVRRGVYRLPFFPDQPLAPLARAWFEVGGRRTDAVVTLRAALALHGLLEPPPGSAGFRAIDLALPRSRRWVSASRAVRVRTPYEHIPQEDRADIGIFVATNLVRTVIDVASKGMPEEELGLVLRRIAYEERVPIIDIKMAASRRQGRKVRRRLDRVARTIPFQFRGPEKPAPGRSWTREGN